MRFRREGGRRVASRKPALLAEPIDDFRDIAAEHNHPYRLALRMGGSAERQQ